MTMSNVKVKDNLNIGDNDKKDLY